MKTRFKFVQLLLFVLLISFLTNVTFAHCDSMEGPVVKASKKALETGNINYVLIWVKPEDEGEVKTIFNKVNKVRNMNVDVQEIADMYFFETVVRIHRMGEGVGYTGLKPADYKPEEGIEAADIAIKENSIKSILNHIDKKYHNNTKELFSNLQAKKSYDINDLAAGREYVEAYVHFIHYVESLFNGETNRIEHHEHKL